MKNITSLSSLAVLIFGLLFTANAFSQTTIYNEGFESNFDVNTNGWTLTSPTSNMFWEGESAGTPSGGTGPNGPNSGTYYAYTEASGSNTFAKEASMTSPFINLSGYTNPTLSFYYHMYGSNTGELEIEINDGGGWTTLTTISGQQQFSNLAAWSNTLSNNLDISAYTGSTIQIRFHATTGSNFFGNFYQSDIAVDDVIISGTTGPEINIQGNSTDITNGDSSPSTGDHTEFGPVNISTTLDRTFTIQNIGSTTLNLTGGTPIVDISGNAAFSILTQPSANNITSGGSDLTFVVRFAPTVAITNAQAVISIENNDSNEAPYTFTIQGTGVDPCPTTISSFPYTEGFETNTIGAWTQDTGDNFNWSLNTGGTLSGSTGPNSASEGSYYIYTEATSNFGNTSNLESPCFDLTGLTNPEFSFSYHMYGFDMGTLNIDISTDSGTTYTTLWTQTGGVQTSNADAWLPANIDLSTYIGQTIKLRLQGITGPGFRSDMSIDDIALVDLLPLPEINIQGNSTDITNGDSSPSSGDHTEFGSINTSTTLDRTFTIQNTGTATLNLTGGTPIVDISGNAAFSILTQPSANNITSGGSDLTFVVRFAPTTDLTNAQAVISIDNNDSNEAPYTFTVQGSSFTPAPEINIQGNGINIVNGDGSPNASDHTEFGTIGNLSVLDRTFTIQNLGTDVLNLTGGANLVSITGDATFSIETQPSANNIVNGGSDLTFVVRFSPTTTVTNVQATISIANDDSNEAPYTFVVQGSSTNPVTEINIQGNGVNITNGDSSPDISDDTEFGSIGNGTTLDHTFTIQNLGTSVLNLTGGSPLVDITGNAAFTVLSQPVANSILASGGDLTFVVRFAPTVTVSNVQATISIDNNDSDEAPYTFVIQGSSFVPNPEIDIQGNSTSISNGDSFPDVADDSDFGNVTVGGLFTTHTFTIENTGVTALSVGAISFSGTNPGDFTVTSTPASTVGVGSSTTFNVSFTPSSSGIKTATISIVNNDSDENPYTFAIQGTGIVGEPQYSVYFENFDDNDGGWTAVTSTGDSWVWTNSYPVSVTNEIAEGGFWRNNSYNSYVNNTNIIVESPVYDFSNLENLKLSLDLEYDTEDNIDGMRILYSISGGAYTLLGASGAGTKWYPDATSALGTDGWNGDSKPTPPAFSGPYNHFENASLNLSDVTFSNQNNVRFRIEFSTNASNTDVGVAFDNFKIEADPTTPLNDASVAPADIVSNLRLWLKANQGISAVDGASITNWEDQAYDTDLDKEDAYSSTAFAPTYRDNANRNINFNPVVDFDNTNTEYMNGKGGYYAKEYFVVMKSDDVVDTSTGSFSPGRQFAIGGRYANESFHEDPTGLGMGSVSSRYSNEVLSHTISSFPNGFGSPPNATSYGRSYSTTTDSFENHPLIINVKTNSAGNASEIYKNGKKVDNTTGIAGNGANLNFNEFSNLQYLIGIGRSGIAGRTTSQMNGMIAEIISYSSPNSAINQQKIQSYLAIKYGTTLQSSTSTLTDHKLNDVNYIDSQGNVIWDTNANSGFNYDIAAIGRDDASLLNQKQSRSQNHEEDVDGRTNGILTMSLTDLYDTNNTNIATNATTFNDRQFLCWGNNGADITLPPFTVNVDMSSGIAGLSTVVSFDGMQKVWKVVEHGGDIPSVKVSIPENAVRNINPPGSYLMFISNTNVFDPTADYRIMTSDGNGNLEADYNFNGTKFVTFGYAHQVLAERSIYFDGVVDYIDVENNLDLNTSEFTISAWIKRDTGTVNASIVSKRDATYTEGYDFKINGAGHLEASWNGGAVSLTSSVEIPEEEWHQVAVIYSGGPVTGTASLYIDGVEDTAATVLPSGNLAAPVATSQKFLIAAADGFDPNTTAYFAGNIDEVRVWDRALTANQLRYIMNQEIIDIIDVSGTLTPVLVQGDIIPTTITNNEISPIPWSSLAGYYPMSVYTYTNTNDMSGNDNQGALRNLNTVDRQTAPLPYETENDGLWDADATWLNNTVQTLPNALSIVDSSPINWNIVEINNDVQLGATATNVRARNAEVQALIINSGDLQVNGNTGANEGIGLTVTHYLKIDGTLDLEGESQLIQTNGSDFDLASTGTLERDQQGTSNTYLYNYWCSPVAPGSNSNYMLSDVFSNVNFITTGFNGTASPVGLADYWIWKYTNRPTDTYSEWQHVRSTGSLRVGEGFTMKGPGAATANQNYILSGQPNNGDFSLAITVGRDYLIGNPYPSALDADEFIKDNISNLEANGRNTNGNIINGALYFWDHFAINSHNLSDYQGGYATYTLMGGARAISNDTRINASGATGTKIPERYIPVGQGFFVSAILDPSLALNTPDNNPNLINPIIGGDILFKNSQRVFQKENVSGTNTGSIFLKSKSKSKSSTTKTVDNRQKIRILFDSPDGYHREILVGADNNATNGFDLGYEATLIESNKEDMYWLLNNTKLIIQAVNDLDKNQVLPLGLKINKTGTATIKIEELKNIPADKSIYVHDKELDTYHNLKNGNYDIVLAPGNYENRFEITFKDNSENTLSIIDIEQTKIDVYYNNDKESIVIFNPELKDVKSVEMFNIIGQSIFKVNNKTQGKNLEFVTKKISSGSYIIKLKLQEGTLSKKVLIE